jgi:hypothetical protein
MSWDLLPNELVEVILANLSLADLARTSATCSSFKSVYCRLMAQQQKAQCDLAYKSCSREQIASLIKLTAHLLKEKFQDSGNMWGQGGQYRIAEDGVLYGPPPFVPLSHMICTARDVNTHVGTCRPSVAVMYVSAASFGMERLKVFFTDNGMGITFLVDPRDDEDLEPVAFMQALLSEGLAKSFALREKMLKSMLEGPDTLPTKLPRLPG